MLMPRRVKHRKQHHPKRRGVAKGGTTTATDAPTAEATKTTDTPAQEG